MAGEFHQVVDVDRINLNYPVSTPSREPIAVRARGHAIAARFERERPLLCAMAICVPEGLWLPLSVQIDRLSEAEGRRNELVNPV